MAKGRKTGGRQKGTPNKATSEARAVALAFLERRTEDEIDKLWQEAKVESATKAFGMWLQAQEFVLPKLSRATVEGPDGGPVEFVIRDLGKGE